MSWIGSYTPKLEVLMPFLDFSSVGRAELLEMAE